MSFCSWNQLQLDQVRLLTWIQIAPMNQPTNRKRVEGEMKLTAWVCCNIPFRQSICSGTAFQKRISLKRFISSSLNFGRVWSEPLYIKRCVQDRIRGVYREVGSVQLGVNAESLRKESSCILQHLCSIVTLQVCQISSVYLQAWPIFSTRQFNLRLYHFWK